MKKICLFTLTLLLTFSLSQAVAASFTLDKIGVLDTAGNRYPQWWYDEANPALSGTATAGAVLSVAVGETASDVTADAEGSWSFSPDTLVQGDNNISIKTDTDTYSFVLSLGQSMPTGGTVPAAGDTTPETTESTVPDTGVGQVMALFGGLLAVSLGWYFFSEKKDSALLE